MLLPLMTASQNMALTFLGRLQLTSMMQQKRLMDMGPRHTIKLVQATPAPSNVADNPCVAEQYE
jgi:hypothetical protein